MTQALAHLSLEGKLAIDFVRLLNETFASIAVSPSHLNPVVNHSAVQAEQDTQRQQSAIRSAILLCQRSEIHGSDVCRER